MTWKRSLGMALLMGMVAVPVLAARQSTLPATSPGSGVPGAGVTDAATNGNIASLLGMLVMKGVLTADEANAIRGSERGSEMHALLDALERKGVITSSDVAAVNRARAQPSETTRTIDPAKQQVPAVHSGSNTGSSSAVRTVAGKRDGSRHQVGQRGQGEAVRAGEGERDLRQLVAVWDGYADAGVHQYRHGDGDDELRSRA